MCSFNLKFLVIFTVIWEKFHSVEEIKMKYFTL